MKKILYIFALIASFCADAQSISPTVGTELCPNQEYTFTVSGLSGNFSNISSIGPVTITQSPSGSGTSITFKAKFADVTGEQGFKITHSNGNYEPKFTKVKSLFGGYSENFSNPTTLSVPICQTTPVALNISGNKYWNTSTNPYTTFGNITTYKYKIPAGWFLNATLSTGSNYITATGPVTLTPTANTGNGGLIEYIAKNDCSGAFFEGTPRYITINRPNPTFTLNPSSLTFVCGTPQTRTFTVSASSTLNCPVTYNWNLGANNGWLYNGSPAPANFSTTTNTITLASANGNVLPSTVRVTPVLNGNNFPQMSCFTNWSPFVSNALINGNRVICLNSSNVFTISNLGNNSIVWSLSNPYNATIINSSQSQITINGFSTGALELIGTITNPCGQVDIIKKTLWVGAPLPLSEIQRVEFCNFTFRAKDFPNTDSSASYSWQFISSSGNASQSNFYTYGDFAQVTACPPFSITFKMIGTNSCGTTEQNVDLWLEGDDEEINRYAIRDKEKFSTINVYPNPVNETLFVNLTDLNNNLSQVEETTIEIFDIQGKKVKNIIEKNNNFSIDVKDLNKGIYLMKIQLKDTIETHKIVVE